MIDMKNAVAAVVEQDTYGSERSKYAASGKLGVSDIGGCREFVRRTIDGEQWSDPEQSTYSMAAFVGTALGDYVESRLRAEHDSIRTQQEVAVTLPLRGVEGEFTLTIPGHPDIIVDGQGVYDLKGLALDTPLPSPDGWTQMGKVSVGDRLFDKDGNIVTVTQVSEVKHMDCSQVTFRNGHSIVCDSEHWWVGRKKGRTWNGDLDLVHADQLSGYTIPVAGELVTPDVELPQDPWMVGYWLGNGDRGVSLVTCHGDDAEEVAAIAKSLGFTALLRRDKRGSNAATVSLGRKGPGARSYQAFSNLFSLGERRVPDGYMQAGTEQRRMLLRGLMDSDGTWNTARNRAVFDSTTEQLARDVAELARSLGQRVQFNSHMAHGYGKDVLCYTVEWTPSFNPFRLSRKRSKWTEPRSQSPTAKHLWHPVVSVEKVDTVLTRCIAVDSPSETYLAGEAMIPTHNTKDGLSGIRRYGASQQHRWQVTMYAAALIADGVIPSDAEIGLIYLDRSGRDATIEPVLWTYDPAVLDEIKDWLSDVVTAIQMGQESSRDMPREWCQACCPFYTSCRGGDTDVEGLIEDPDILTNVEKLLKARELEKEAKDLKREASGELLGVAGNTQSHTVRWVHVNASSYTVDREPYDRLDVRKRKA